MKLKNVQLHERQDNSFDLIFDFDNDWHIMLNIKKKISVIDFLVLIENLYFQVSEYITLNGTGENVPIGILKNVSRR